MFLILYYPPTSCPSEIPVTSLKCQRGDWVFLSAVYSGRRAAPAWGERLFFWHVEMYPSLSTCFSKIPCSTMISYQNHYVDLFIKRTELTVALHLHVWKGIKMRCSQREKHVSCLWRSPLWYDQRERVLQSRDSVRNLKLLHFLGHPSVKLPGFVWSFNVMDMDLFYVAQSHIEQSSWVKALDLFSVKVL